MLFILFSSDYVFLFNMMQMDGSNRARVGLLLYACSDSVSTILLMKDIIDRTISSFRFVPLFSFLLFFHFQVEIQNGIVYHLFFPLIIEYIKLVSDLVSHLVLVARKRYWTSYMGSANIMKVNIWLLLLRLVIRLALLRTRCIA